MFQNALGQYSGQKGKSGKHSQREKLGENLAEKF